MDIKLQNFEIRNIDYRELKPIQGNLKDLKKINYSKLKKSFTEKGLFIPIFVWDDKGEFKILDGHGRERLFQREKAEFVDASGNRTHEVPCLMIKAESLTDAKEKLLIISSQYQTITQEGLDEFIAGLDEDWVKTTTQFDNLFDDFERSLQSGLSNPDSIPSLPTEPKTKRGDIYQLGDHRLMCGSSIDPKDVDRLMDGVKEFHACITDPPYSVDYQKSKKKRDGFRGDGGKKGIYEGYQENDDPKAILSFMKFVRSNVLLFSYPINRHFFELADALKEFEFEFFKELIWVKGHFSFWSKAIYQQKHESILLCLKEKALSSNLNGVQYLDHHEPILIMIRKGKKMTQSAANVPIKQSTVFEFPKPAAHDLHPTAKPIDLWVKLVGYHVPHGGLLYEPFCGSGTSIIAAEMVGCKCYAMELAPEYCDVIVKRWEEFTGRKAVLLA